MPGGKPTHYAGDLRAHLLDGAERALASGGVSALSLRAVAKEVGVSHAAPAHYFPDKRALLTALATNGADELAAALGAALHPDQSPVERLRTLGLAYVAFAQARPALFRVMMQRNEVDNSDALDSAEAAAYRILASAVTEAVAAGWASGSSDPETTTALLWSTVHGVAALVLDRELPVASIAPIVDGLIALGER